MPTTNEISEHIGVEITGMSSPDLVTPAAAAETKRLLARHGVVVYRQIHLDDDHLLAFSGLLGTLVAQPTGEHRHPQIQTITLDPAKTHAILASYRQGNFQWHIDGMTDEFPQKATLLTAREVDPAGGDTEFATTYAAYETLSTADQRELEGLTAIHSFAAAQAKANPDATEEDRAGWNRLEPRVHPLVWKRSDGRRSLLLGATAQEIVGYAPDQSRGLLDRLLEHCTQPEFTLRHHWQVGDLVIWDNTGMLHRALPFEPTSRRLMHRTTLVGDEPTMASSTNRMVV